MRPFRIGRADVQIWLNLIIHNTPRTKQPPRKTFVHTIFFIYKEKNMNNIETTCKKKKRKKLKYVFKKTLGFPGGSNGKESACGTGDSGSIPGSGRSPGEGNGNQLQYSCLENFMNRRAWWAIVYGITKSQTPN